MVAAVTEGPAASELSELVGTGSHIANARDVDLRVRIPSLHLINDFALCRRRDDRPLTVVVLGTEPARVTRFDENLFFGHCTYSEIDPRDQPPPLQDGTRGCQNLSG